MTDAVELLKEYVSLADQVRVDLAPLIEDNNDLSEFEMGVILGKAEDRGTQFYAKVKEFLSALDG